MNKKIFAILSLAILAIVCMGTVSAFDLGSLFGGNDSNSTGENITIDGIKFYIPAGFEEQKNQSIDNQTNITDSLKTTTNGKAYANVKTGDAIAIAVTTYDGVEVDDAIVKSVGNVNKTINGVNGYTYDGGIIKGFAFAKNGKLGVVTTSNETLFDQIIVG